MNAKASRFFTVQTNGHIIVYGGSITHYQAKCISCEKCVEFPRKVFTLSDSMYKLLTLYSFHTFVEESCEKPRDSMSDVVSDKVMSKYIGNLHTDDTIVSIESEIKDLLGAENIRIDLDIN